MPRGMGHQKQAPRPGTPVLCMVLLHPSSTVGGRGAWSESYRGACCLSAGVTSRVHVGLSQTLLDGAQSSKTELGISQQLWPELKRDSQMREGNLASEEKQWQESGDIPDPDNTHLCQHNQKSRQLIMLSSCANSNAPPTPVLRSRARNCLFTPRTWEG